MKIRTKLAITLILLQIFGITAISSFSILFIRSYLLENGIENLKSDTEWIAKDLIFENTEWSEPLFNDIKARVDKLAEVSSYDFKVHDSEGKLIISSNLSTNNQDLPYTMQHLVLEDEQNRFVYNHPDSSRLYSYIYIGNNPKEAHFFEISKLKDDFYEIITTIRWIIYSGMFISIGIVIIVSLIISRSITKPILALNDAALQIATGDTKNPLPVQRKDEIGTLGQSLEKMANHLQDDNERLAKLNLRQRQFFGDITHEVRNPLHTLLTTFDIIELDVPHERKIKAIETAKAQIARIRLLLEDLSTLARFDEGPNLIDIKEYSLKPQLERLFNYYIEESSKKGLELTLDAKEIKVRADERKIEQVLDNLISNAIKYTQEGSVRILAEVVQDRILIKIEDSGIGIEESHIPHLFDRFYRTDKARSRDLGGTGLGLSVVKSILYAHQSSVEVSSIIGKGSIFSFFLPKA